MSILQSIIQSPETLPSVQLTRDLTKHLKRGHRWVFANCVGKSGAPAKNSKENASADPTSHLPSGMYSIYFKQELIGLGVLQADTQLRLRILCLAEEPFFRKNSMQKTLDLWVQRQWKNALQIRQGIDSRQTDSFRLLNGEGDGVPGLIVDIYRNTAVIKHDHPIMERIWNRQTLAEWLVRDLPQVQCVYFKRRNDDKEKGISLIGQLPEEVQFKENNLLFASNIRDAAKTGFFLDQRDNRALIGRLAKDREVLNLFSYTGGFSIYAAAGGAKKVTSVDIAKVAIEAVKRNFEINHLQTPHDDIAVDAFEYVENQLKLRQKYDLVITDPPSFAPNEKSVPQATAAYIKIFSQSIRLVRENGYFAASSCSSHISSEAFIEITREAFSKANNKGTMIYFGAQPIDHPYPLQMTELRYLKFALFRVEA